MKFYIKVGDITMAKTTKKGAQELSLKELFNLLSKQQTVFGDKLERLYDLFSGVLPFPSDVTSSNDSPGLWPDTGINVYAILPEYNLATAFCTVGILLNVGQGRYKYQFMVVQSDELAPTKNGKLYYRYAKATANDWSGWKRFVYLYELTGSVDANGNPILDEFGKQITDTEDCIPENNPNNTSITKNLYVEKARKAQALETPRKIELVGMVNGSVMFDGSQDVQLKTDASQQFFVPLNVRFEAQYRANDEYHLIATLPTSASNTYDYVLVTGHIGGAEKAQGKAWFTACISNRGGSLANGFYVGTMNSNDLVVYKNVYNELNVYVKLRGWNDDMKISVYGSAQAVITDEVKSLPSGSSFVWSLKNDTVHVEGNKIYGEIVGGSSTAVWADHSKDVPTEKRTKVKDTLYAVGVVKDSGQQPYVYTDTNIQFTDKSHIKAPVFEGDLIGKSSTSGVADSANLVKVSKNTTGYQCYLLGTYKGQTTNSLPRYDTNIYMTGNEGQLYIKDIDSAKATIAQTIIDTETVNKKLELPATSSFYSHTNTAKFNYIQMGASGATKNAQIEMNQAKLFFGDGSASAPKVVFNVASGSNPGVFKDKYGGNMGVLNISGGLNPTRVYNAVYNDVAELFPCTIEPQAGDVLMLDVNTEEETYVLSSEGAKCIAGVVSDTYGYLLGGDPDMTSEELAKKYAPVGLAGRVNVNVIGAISKGDKLVATNGGCARAYKSTDSLEEVIGYAVEADNRTDKRRLKMKIK